MFNKHFGLWKTQKNSTLKIHNCLNLYTWIKEIQEERVNIDSAMPPGGT